ncbi:MAG TPA: PEP-CTERM sorting domain-containing protein [Candidatus Aquabacterium excrementipullorum]|nr:PEP-CTERM sorting domain-containing protein [Candidatus Aquabacterium excrementipullorum]
MIKTIAKRAAIAAATLLASAPLWAATLSLQPSTASVAQGGSFTVDLLVSDLGTGDDLGSFDLSVLFDASVLQLNGYTLGTGLGDTAAGEALDASAGLTASGSLNLSQVSFLWDLSSQASSFKLASLTFTAAQVGNSALSISGVTLGDAWGSSLNATTVASAVAVTAAVPEPETLALMLAGLGVVGVALRRHAA